MSINQDVLGGLTDDIAWKAPCMVATTADMTSTMIGLSTIDGYAVQTNDRVLVWQNVDETTNGIYNAQGGAWTRALDFATSSSIAEGTQTIINNGTLYAAHAFVLTTVGQPGQINISEANLTFSHYLPGTPSPGSAVPRLITSGHTDTLATDDGTVGWNVNYSGTKTETIPSAVSAGPGKYYTVKDVYGDCATNNIQLVPASGTIDKLSSFTMNVNKMAITIESDGISNWMIV